MTNVHELAVLPVLPFPGNDEWRDFAECLGSGINFFDGRRAKKLKAICAVCTVREECLDYAVRNELIGGVFGGMTEKERAVVYKVRYAN